MLPPTMWCFSTARDRRNIIGVCLERGTVLGLRPRFEGHSANKSAFDIEVDLVVVSDSIEIRNDKPGMLHFLLLAVTVHDLGRSYLRGLLAVLKVVCSGVRSMGRTSIASGV